jgi:hypothetical protein
MLIEGAYGLVLATVVILLVLMVVFRGNKVGVRGSRGDTGGMYLTGSTGAVRRVPRGLVRR